MNINLIRTRIILHYIQYTYTHCTTYDVLYTSLYFYVETNRIMLYHIILILYIMYKPLDKSVLGGDMTLFFLLIFVIYYLYQIRKIHKCEYCIKFAISPPTIPYKRVLLFLFKLIHFNFKLDFYVLYLNLRS
jgi:hypothetical protein